jgi:hypothetical protein
MAPSTYVGCALSAALGGRIRFGSLKFIDTDGPMPVLGFYPVHSLCLSDSDFVVDHLGQPHPSEGAEPPPRMPS